jgi:arylsulfatase
VTIPEIIKGYPQLPVQGVSFAFTFDDARAPTRHNIQYYELHGGRAIYKDGWKASVYHPRNFSGQLTEDPHFNPRPYSQDKWELYNLNEDWNEIHDVAARYSDKLKELQALFDNEAKINNVYPLHDYNSGRPEPVIKPRTVILEGTSQKIKVNIGKGNVIITANIETASKKDEGVIFANGGLYGGTSLYIKDGKLQYLLNDGVSQIVLTSPGSLSTGKNVIRIEYSDSQVILFVNGKEVALSAFESRNRYLAGIAGEGISVGQDPNSPVSKSYPPKFPFTGKVKKIIIEQ